MSPRAGGHTPTSARTSEVLPEPLGPMMPIASPAIVVKLTLLTSSAPLCGDMTVRFSAPRLCCGLGSAVLTGSVPIPANVRVNRPMLSRAATKVRQCTIAVSIGANARAIMMEQAIMAPGISICRITR